MIIKKKIFKSNMIMLFVPLVTSIVLSVVMILILLNNILPGVEVSMEKGSGITFIIIYQVFGAIITLVALTVNAFYTNKSVKKFLIPINRLCAGAQRIQTGNYDVNIEYENDDELAEVCRSFNEMQKEIKANIEKNRLYEKNRNELFAGISHDLRTPLTSIKSYVKGLQDNIARTPTKQKKYLETIYSKTSEMEVLIEQLFLFSKLESDNFPFKFSLIVIQKYIVTFLDSKEYDFIKNNTHIGFKNFCTNEKAMIDGEQFKRVLNNIIDNCIKHNSGKNIKIFITISCENSKIIIRIKDDGVGVSDNQLEYLFERFYRNEKLGNSSLEGSGLGLSIAKKIIHAHKGTISAENKNGLTITITLPEEKEKFSEKNSYS